MSWWTEFLGDLAAPLVEEHVEVRVTGQPEGQFPPYDFTFRTDRASSWEHCAQVAARALTQWTGGNVEVRRVRVETRASRWVPVPLDALTDETDIAERETVAVCRACDGPIVIPFSTADEALQWAQRHRDGTGHDVRTVAGWPHPPSRAYALAFPEDQP